MSMSGPSSSAATISVLRPILPPPARMSTWPGEKASRTGVLGSATSVTRFTASTNGARARSAWIGHCSDSRDR